VRRIGGGPYNRDEYREFGAQAYENGFDRFLGRHNVLVFTPYWDERFPKLLSRELMLSNSDLLPEVVSDVTCDIEGSTECTLKESTIAEPVWGYDPRSHQMTRGFTESGLTVTAVDNLPSQLGDSCSRCVSDALSAVLPQILSMDLSKPLESSGLPEHFWPAFITYNGELTQPYRHLSSLL
jgi:alpha-aminoadipic semialdehyde synthase